MRSTGATVLTAIVATVMLAALVPVHAGARGLRRGSDGRIYRPPVTAPVRDPFRPPPQPWLAGNRGIEYATVPGTVIRAIGPGVVTFSGQVAGERDVTVLHPDGLRSSYVDLVVARVRRSVRVAAGDVIGLSTDRLHLGVRRGDQYLDPASLWGRRIEGGRVVLVPVDGAGPGRPPPGRAKAGPAPPPGVGDRLRAVGASISRTAVARAGLGA